MMILLAALLLMSLILIAITVAAIAIGGAGFIIIFGDVIVCIALLVFIIKKLFCKKK